MKTKQLVLGILITAAAVGQLLAAWLLYDPAGPAWRINLGWGVMMISALFGWLPIFTFRKKGEISGRSYVTTTELVDTGIYSIVRHPQYTAGALLSIALPLITWHWLVLASGMVSVTIYFLNTFQEEKINLEKFGSAYQNYQREVPRMNILLGIYLWTRRSFRDKKQTTK